MTPHVFPEGCFFKTTDDIKDRHITIMGLGRNGGGEACVKFFLKYGAFVTVTDKAPKETLQATIDSIENTPGLDLSRLTYVLGEHRFEDFENADCVIKNPGVDFDKNEYLQHAKVVESDISVFLALTEAPVIAVTGSKGKSSTVSAIEWGLKESGINCFLGGNITVSPLTFLEQTNENTPVILELSSWQLRDLRGRKLLKPKIAVITKIVPDHQNFYGNMDSYVDDKKLIYADQDENDYTILDADSDGYLKEASEPKENCSCWGDLFASETKAKVLRYSKNGLAEKTCGVYQKQSSEGTTGIYRFFDENSGKYIEEKVMGSLFVPGEHMKINVLNAALVMKLMGISSENCIEKLGAFKGIHDRLEYFHEWQGKNKVLFYNDTCATVPEAAAAATQSFGKPVILIAGGNDKQLDFTPLAKTISGLSGTVFVPPAVYLLSGKGTDKLTEMLDEYKTPYEGPFDSLNVLLTVLKSNLEAQAINTEGISEPLIAVFSPGATSFGMFDNEFDRGRKFKQAVKEIFC